MTTTSPPIPVVPAARARLRVLVIAPGLDPSDVGEAWSAARWVEGLAEHCSVTVLTWHRRSHEGAADGLAGVRVVAWPDLPLVDRFEGMNRRLKPGYVRFFLGARRWIRAALARGERFDVVHQLTPIALRYPSPAAGLPVPLVLGPLAGSLGVPPGLRREVGTEPWYVRLRETDRLRLRFDPWLRATYGGARLVIGAAPYVRGILRGVPVRDFAVASETGVRSLPDVPPRRSEANSRFRALFVGRLTRTKGARDAVRAMAVVGDRPGVTLDVVGDGEDRAACEAEAARLGVGDRVTFHGRRPRAEVDRFYRRADAFVFPSFREPSGNVVIEAMSFGLPLVVADAGGPGHVVRDSFGHRVPVDDPRSFAAGVAGAIRRLADDPDRRRRMGAAAREEVRGRHLWRGKVEWLLDRYERVVTRTPGAAWR